MVAVAVVVVVVVVVVVTAPLSAEVLGIDQERRARITAAGEAQAARNAASKQVGQAKSIGDNEKFERLRALIQTINHTNYSLIRASILRQSQRAYPRRGTGPTPRHQPADHC